MERRRSYFVAFITILAGILFQMQALGLLGKNTQSILFKAWPIIIIAAGLDLFFGDRRIIGAAVLCFTGFSMLVVTFYPNGQSSEIWKLFINFWPLMLILYGIDNLFSNKNFLSSAIAIALLVVVTYAILATLGVPIMSKIPVPKVWKTNLPNGASATLTAKTPSPLGTKQTLINYAMPPQSIVGLRIQAATGKLQLKTADLDNRFLEGTIALISGETLNENVEQSNESMTFLIASSGTGVGDGPSIWDLRVDPEKMIDLSAEMGNGYQIIDLRHMNLARAVIASSRGNIDLMLPFQANVPIDISAESGDIRVFIPENVAMIATINGAGNIEIPDSYLQNGNQISPAMQNPGSSLITALIQSNGGNVKIKLFPN